jgi:uncharacterized protein (DUF58 family)
MIRTALSALTLRGRAFVSAGVTAVLCGLLFSLDDLSRVGVFLAALPVVAALVVTRGRHRLALVRSVSPHRIGVGQSAEVTLHLRNEGRGPTGLLLLEEQVPYSVGTRPRFVIDRMPPTWERRVSYRVRSEVRGRFVLGPVTVRAADPFGLVELDRAFRSTATVTVTPKVLALPVIGLAGSWTGSGDNRPRDFAGGSAEDVTVREYRRGDDLRRVHWRSSAHAGELMVRREEQPWQSRATVFIDNRAHVHRGVGAASSLEYAVSAAASIVAHLVQRGFRTRLVSAGGTALGEGWHDQGSPSGEVGPLLDALAVLQPEQGQRLDSVGPDETHARGLVVAIFGDLGAADQAVVNRLRHQSPSAIALVLDVDRWSRATRRPEGELPVLRTLTASGWRAVAAGPQDPLPSKWREVGAAVRRADAGERLSS